MTRFAMTREEFEAALAQCKAAEKAVFAAQSELDKMQAALEIARSDEKSAYLRYAHAFGISPRFVF